MSIMAASSPPLWWRRWRLRDESGDDGNRDLCCRVVGRGDVVSDSNEAVALEQLLGGIKQAAQTHNFNLNLKYIQGQGCCTRAAYRATRPAQANLKHTGKTCTDSPAHD